MPTLKNSGRQISQPNAPDISQAGEAYANMGRAVQGVAKTAGEYIKATRDLEEKSLLAAADNDFETDLIRYRNDPNINQESFQVFNQNLDAKIQGYATQAQSKEFIQSLQTSKQKFSNKALDVTLKQGMKNEVRDISLAIHDLQEQYTKQIGEQDLSSAASTRQAMASFLNSMAVRGASAEEIIKISDSTDVLGIAAEAKAKLKNAGSKAERSNILKEMAARPDTSVNVKAFGLAYQEFSRLNKLYDEGDDLSEAWANIQSGNNWSNRELDAKSSDALVGIVSKNISAKSDEPASEPRDVPIYQATPTYPGQSQTFDYSEELAAESEGRKQRTYLVEGVVQSIEAPKKRESSLFELAEAHQLVGSKNAREFPKAVRNRLHGGNGELANEAVTAISYVENKNDASLELDAETDMIYTEFKVRRDAGRTDYDNMIAESRQLIKDSKGAIELNSNIYDDKFSLKSKPGRENLNKAFQEATGVDAIKSGSSQALSDFNHIFKSKFIINNGKYDTALDAAKREMNRTHGGDIFTGDQYVAFPPTKMLQGLDETQISNQILVQLVNQADKDPNLSLPERYGLIKGANESERMNVNYVSLASQPAKYITTNAPKQPAAHVAERFKPRIQVTQKIEGTGTITGTLFVKPNELTEQNNSGMPVWEAWMRDSQGREWPITDNDSPYKNRLLIFGKTAAEFAPTYTKNLNAENIQKIADEALAQEGLRLYNGTSWSPLAIVNDFDNYFARKAYINDEANKERVKNKVEKIIGKEQE